MHEADLDGMTHSAVPALVVFDIYVVIHVLDGLGLIALMCKNNHVFAPVRTCVFSFSYCVDHRVAGVRGLFDAQGVT